jgi:hypothetical protein
MTPTEQPRWSTQPYDPADAENYPDHDHADEPAEGIEDPYPPDREADDGGGDDDGA